MASGFLQPVCKQLYQGGWLGRASEAAVDQSLDSGTVFLQSHSEVWLANESEAAAVVVFSDYGASSSRLSPLDTNGESSSMHSDCVASSSSLSPPGTSVESISFSSLS